MLSTHDLKSLLHQKKLSRQDKLLLILSTFAQPTELKAIVARGGEAGLKIPASWNVATVFRRSAGLAIRTPAGWEITDAGRASVRQHEGMRLSNGAAQIAHDLREHLARVRDDDTRSFVTEAVECFEARFYRSAVVMSWLAAVHVLHRHVLRLCLA